MCSENAENGPMPVGPLQRRHIQWNHPPTLARGACLVSTALKIVPLVVPLRLRFSVGLLDCELVHVDKNPPPLPFWGVQGRCGSIGASWIAFPQMPRALSWLHCILLINLVFHCILLITCFPGKPDLRYTTIFLAHCKLLIKSGLHCILLINYFRLARRCNVRCYSIRAFLFSELRRAKLRC